MKYLITESQLSNIIFGYLTTQNFYKVKYHGDYIFWSSKKSWENTGRVYISTHRSNDDCFVNSDLVSEISSMFSLSLEDALYVIGGWVNTQIDFNINHFYSDYGAD